MNSLLIAALVAFAPTIGLLLVNRQLNRQRQDAAKEKIEDRKREDEVRVEAKRQQEEVAEEKLRQDTLAAAAIEKAAQLLYDTQQVQKAGTDEVARLAAGEIGHKDTPYGVPVIISYVQTGQHREAMMMSVPREGESMRLRNGAGDPSLIVVRVVHMEALLPPPNPSVIIVVREQTLQEIKVIAEQVQDRV